MSSPPIELVALPEGPPPPGPVSAGGPRFARVRSASPLLVVGGSIVAVLVAVAVLAPLLSPYAPKAISDAALLHPSPHHLLGTDDLGEDIASQLIWGTRTSLITAVGAAALIMTVATVVGVGSGLLGGRIDAVIMRGVDVALSLPVFPLLVVVATLAGAHLLTIILALGIIGWPKQARVLRGQTLTLRQRGFVGAARGFGGGPLYVIRRHLVPGLGPIIAAGLVNWASIVLILESSLALFGLSDPFEVSWGTILNRAFDHTGVFFTLLWTWWMLPAAMAIIVAILGFALLGVGLDATFNRRSGTSR